MGKTSAAQPVSEPVSTFIAGLPATRRVEFERVRDVLRAAMPEGYEEVKM